MADVAEVLMLRDPGGVCDCVDAGPPSVLKTHNGNAHTQYLRLLTPTRSTKFGGNPIILNT